jgi:molybdate/tungstate transport system substrate-binding protein
MNRRTLLAGAAAAAGAGLTWPALRASAATSLDVAYAGSMGSLMEGPIKAAASQALGIEMHGRALGSDALAALIVGGSVPVDVFVPVTPRPMNTVLKAGKASVGTPIARTEMVIAYASKGQFAQQFADAVAGKPGAMPWWKILQQPGLRFGRTDPVADPQGRNIIFTLQLAETYYKQPGLAQKVLGANINTAQIFSEPTVQARLQSGELDAASAYRVQPGPFNIPYVSLPDEINLGDQAMSDGYAKTSLVLGDKTYKPEPLVYYAAAIAGSAHPDQAAAFVDWLAKGAQSIFRQNYYDAPTGASALRA